MYKSLAIACLLGQIDAINIQSQTRSGIKSLEQNEAIADHMMDVEENMHLMIDDTVKVKTQTRATLAAGCTNGIKRFTNGTSNTWQTFKDAHSTSGLFQDAGFPAATSSLYCSNCGGDASDIQSMQRGISVWKRPSEMGYSGSPSFWGSKGKPVPDGINQQSLGDCWFLAAASAVAEQPERIKRVIWNDSYDKNGAFRYYFWVKDKWHGVNIDDRLPSRSWGSQFRPWATQRSQNGAWWMPLMEKAYAKLDQNYERIIAGMGYEGLRTLTGMPTLYHSLSKGANEASDWTFLKALSDKNWPMTTPCCNIGQYGLISGHAYTLLKVIQLKDGTKLAQVRNPWSSESYKGPWSDSSDKWTAANKQEAGYVNANDGKFFMPFSLYVKEYWGVSIAAYQPYKGYQQISVKQTVRSGQWTVKNPVAQEMYIVGETYSDRNYPRNCDPNNNYVLYLYNAAGSQVGKYGFIGWAGWGFQGKMGAKLPAGDYQLTLVNQAYTTQAADITLNFYWLDQKGSATAKS